MSYVSTYNLLKEGDIYNVGDGSYYVTTSGIKALYDGDASIPAFIIPASGVASLEVEFGEYFDVGVLKYYTSPVVLSNISITYGLASGTENVAATVSSGTFVCSYLDSSVGFIRITQSGTVDTSVYELYLEGVRNDTIGVGHSVASGTENVFMDNSPISSFSSDPLEIPVYNDNEYTVDIKVAVAPTGQSVDNYIYLGTTSTGTFYGINDYGQKQPAFKTIPDLTSDMSSVSLDSLLSDWDVNFTSESYFDTSGDYLRIFTDYSYVQNERVYYLYNDSLVAAFTSKEEFTGNQSFTIGLDVRYVDASMDSMLEGESMYTANKLMLGFTNSFPIKEHFQSTVNSYGTTQDRVGKSLAAVWYGTQAGTGSSVTDLCAGGAVCENDYNGGKTYTNFQRFRASGNSHPIISAVPVEYLSSKVFAESTYLDGTITSPWRRLQLSYDHRTRTAYFYFDRVLLSKFRFNSSCFFEGNHLFFGFVGMGYCVVDVRNLTVEKDKVVLVTTNQTSADAYQSYDSINHGPDKLIDNRYGDNFTCSWASGANPPNGSYVDIEFGDVTSIDAVRLIRPQEGDSITLSGVSAGIRYSPYIAWFTFDTGETRYATFYDTDYTDGMDGWDVSYLITSSGSNQPVEGVSSVRCSFVSFYDRGSGHEVASVDEIQFYTLSGVESLSFKEEESNTYQWRNGYFRNIKSRGTDSVLELEHFDYYDVSAREDCENLVFGFNYYATSPVLLDEDPYRYTSYHYADSLFMRQRGGDFRTVCHMQCGKSGSIWRYFEEKISLSAVFITVFTESDEGHHFKGKMDKWKLQYLKENGNPNVDSDWVNIPPKSVPYPTPCDYATYVQYLIDNNDGEYYTNYINALDFKGSTILLPTSSLCYKNNYLQKTLVEQGYYQYPYGNAVDDIYIEFDTTYRTQGVRFVIEDGYKDVIKTIDADGYTITYFLCYNDKSAGVYVSPVFDTGTKQNTERIYVDSKQYGGTSSITFRSSDSPPTSKHDSAYESWEDMGPPFAGVESSLGGVFPFSSGFSMVAVGDDIYFLGCNYESVLIFNTKTHKWSVGEEYPTGAGGAYSVPDTRVLNNSVYTGSEIICVSALTIGGVSNAEIMRYHLTPTEYNYVGWEKFPYQRQEAAIHASMVYDGGNRLFFISRSGEITVCYIDTGMLTTEFRANLELYGYAYREGCVPAYHEGKLYVAGGGYGFYIPLNSLDVYDIASDTWTVGPSMPYNIGYCQSLYVGNYLYVLPFYPNMSDDFAPYIKLDMSTGEWVSIPTLSYNRPTSLLDALPYDRNSPLPDKYCLCGEYVYAFNAIRNDFRRFKVVPAPWEPGSLPGKDDYDWYISGGKPWHEVTVGGELMPQDRYIQYRVELECQDGNISPAVSDAVVVSPLTVGGVPPKGESSFFVKTGISVDRTYEMWYTGEYYNGVNLDRAILYAVSSDGVYSHHNTPVLNTTTISGSDRHMYVHPFVVKRSETDYTMWVSNVYTHGGEEFYGGNIHMFNSDNGYFWGDYQHAIGRGLLPPYDSASVYSPTVLYSAGLYSMWYTAEDISGDPRILKASSSDGLNWYNFVLSHDLSTPGLTVEADSCGAKYPAVVYYDSRYHLWYEGIDSSGVSRIIHCVSYDGVTWVDHVVALTPADLGGLGFYGCGRPTVQIVGDLFYMWFTAYYVNGDIVYRAKSGDGNNWSEFTPVLSSGEEGTYDSEKSERPVFVVNAREEPANVMKCAKIKIYND